LTLLFASMRIVFSSSTAAAYGPSPPPPSASGQGSCSYAGSGAAIWSLMVAFVTLRDAGVLASMRTADVSRKITAAILLGLWLLTAIATTIEGPFAAAGNGWFAIWFGLIAAFCFALEEFGRAMPTQTHLAYAVLHTASGLVLAADALPYLWEPAMQVGIPNHGLSNYAFAYAVSAVLLGGGLALLLAAQAGALPPPLVAVLDKASGCLTTDCRVLACNVTGLKVFAIVLLANALTAAIVLTYYFLPYTQLSNGFLACWFSVGASASLLRDEPPPPDPTPPTQLAVVTTVSGDVAAAEITRDIDAPPGGGAQGGTAAADSTPVETSAPATRPPFAAGLAVCSVLVIIAAADRFEANQLNGMGGEAVIALAVPCLTMLLVLLRAWIVHTRPRDATFVSAFISVLWLAAALLLTFERHPSAPQLPFVDAGNGYIATWLALICALQVTFNDYALRKAEQTAAQ
jgi:hypothetical protein